MSKRVRDMLCAIAPLPLLLLVFSRLFDDTRAQAGSSSSDDRGLFGKKPPQQQPQPSSYAHPYPAPAGYPTHSGAGHGSGGHGSSPYAESFTEILLSNYAEKASHRAGKIAASFTPGIRPVMYVKTRHKVNKLARKMGIKPAPPEIQLHMHDKSVPGAPSASTSAAHPAR